MKKMLIVQYRYTKDDMWKSLFRNGEWHRWKTYREKDVPRTIEILKRKHKNFEFRVKP